MNEKSKYNTHQRETILSFFKKNPDSQFSADEIAEKLKSDKIGKSTVYRIIAEFAESGIIKKFSKAEGRGSVYQFLTSCGDCDTHFHLKCLKCGKLIHLENGLSDTMLNILHEHDFDVNEELTMLVGKCSECREKSGKN